MSRPIEYQSLEKLIRRYLANNGLTIDRYIDGKYYKVTQKDFAKELSNRIYDSKHKVHDLIAERATHNTLKEIIK